MSEQTKPPILLCIPSSKELQVKLGCTEYIPPDGFTLGNCDFCAVQVVLGPRQAAVFRTDNRTQIICAFCAAKFKVLDATNLTSLGGPGGKYKTKFGNFGYDK